MADPTPPPPTTTTTTTTRTTTHPPIILRTPSKYLSPSSSSSASSDPSTPGYTHPPLTFLQRTWAITHSTLPMWRKAKNVRITYTILPPSTPGGPLLLDDVVESEPVEKSWMPQPKQIRGIDTLSLGGGSGGGEGRGEGQGDGEGEARGGNWDWRGKGWLKVASSHWEVLGWGERDVDGVKEKWMVTWFAPSLFTPAGVDVYSDQMGGGSEELVRDVLGALEGCGCREVGDLCKGEMRAVRID